jgi:hypothetical protein
MDIYYVDCEGAGEMFRVTTLPACDENKANTAASPVGGERGHKNSNDFFGRPTFLTVSGQVRDLSLYRLCMFSKAFIIAFC